jgi:hypothetical protein
MSEFIFVLDHEYCAENFKNDEGDGAIPSNLAIKMLVEAEDAQLASDVIAQVTNREMWKLASA